MTLLALSLSLSPASAGTLSDGPDDDCCAKCECEIDDLTSNDYPGYVDDLETMIDELVYQTDVPQVDAGYGVAGIIGGKVPIIKTADVWTEQVVLGNGEYEPGHYVEHWFLDSDELLDQPGAAFALRYKDLLEWPEMLDVLTEDNVDEEDVSHLYETYVKMDIRYVLLPDAVTTAKLKYVGNSVAAYEFDGHIGEELVARMRREVHYDAGQVSARYEHWLFLDSADGFQLLDQPDETMNLSAAEAAPTTRAFYEAFQGTDTVAQAAVISYTSTLVLHSEFFFDPNFDEG